MEKADQEAMLALACEAADAAAGELRARFRSAASGVRAKSTPTDLVSDADLAAERAIREVIGARRPKDTIIGEEGGETGDGELRWVVDPLDGTTNFLFGIPTFAVSIACEDSSVAVAGVVLDPMREERFTATADGDARLNGELIVGSDADDLGHALVATGFGYDAALRARQAEVLGRVLPQVRDIRRAGAAALDLCWCACGRVDAYYERGLQPWDMAAGALIAERAGQALRELPAADEDPSGLAVAPAALLEELWRLVTGSERPRI